MILVLASAFDSRAQALVTGLGPGEVRLMTPGDLSAPGWQYRVGRPRDGVAVASGQRLAQSAIRGVFTRLPWIDPAELSHVAPQDRSFVASEMQAFLVAWLSQLTCPVVNRPTPLCLCGPGWRREQWLYAAAKVGLPVVTALRRHVLPPDRDVAPLLAPPEVTVTVIGQTVTGTGEGAIRVGALRLAAMAGVDLLGLGFVRRHGGLALTSATLWPDLASPADIAALRLCFTVNVADQLGGPA